jgi:hypothetical protein
VTLNLVTENTRLALTGDLARDTEKALAYFKTTDAGEFEALADGGFAEGFDGALELNRRHRHPHPALPARLTVPRATVAGAAVRSTETPTRRPGPPDNTRRQRQTPFGPRLSRTPSCSLVRKGKVTGE